MSTYNKKDERMICERKGPGRSDKCLGSVLFYVHIDLCAQNMEAAIRSGWMHRANLVLELDEALNLWTLSHYFLFHLFFPIPFRIPTHTAETRSKRHIGACIPLLRWGRERMLTLVLVMADTHTLGPLTRTQQLSSFSMNRPCCWNTETPEHYPKSTSILNPFSIPTYTTD